MVSLKEKYKVIVIVDNYSDLARLITHLKNTKGCSWRVERITELVEV